MEKMSDVNGFGFFLGAIVALLAVAGAIIFVVYLGTKFIALCAGI